MTDSKFSQLKAECEANIQQVIDTMTIDESRALQSGLHSGIYRSRGLSRSLFFFLDFPVSDTLLHVAHAFCI